MYKQLCSNKNLQLLEESLMLVKVAIAYCNDEAKPYEEVRTLKEALIKLSMNLKYVLNSL